MNEKVTQALRKMKEADEGLFNDTQRFSGTLADFLGGVEPLIRENLIALVETTDKTTGGIKKSGYARLKQAPNRDILKYEADALVYDLRKTKGLDKELAQTVVGSLAALFTDDPLYTGEDSSALNPVLAGTSVFTKADAKNASGAVSIPFGYKEIEAGAFALRTGLVSVEIPDSVTVINDGAFSECRNLKKVKLPAGLKSINPHLFSSCVSLSNVVLPNKIEYIGENAFGGCESLTEVVIPDGVTGLGANAFYSCAGLKSLTVPTSVYTIGSGALSGCDGLTVVCRENSYAHRFCKRLFITVKTFNQ